MQVEAVVPLGTAYPQITTAVLVATAVEALVAMLVQEDLYKLQDYLTQVVVEVEEIAVAIFLHQAVQVLLLLDIQLKEK
jgi:hypothetical protein